MEQAMTKGKEIPKELLLQGANEKIYSITIDINGAIKATETTLTIGK